ncbi:caspase family protein [Aridibaculum aurantiacum]|uniref:caspase family protein n=1 Tax=Aridibaculum aurantiacum TaxID=2810307 RepID=UPI001A977738|nr:caspase family protein [Aridibaculum aurantiacum]
MKLFLLIPSLIGYLFVAAQNRHALIIGINNYYEKPGQLHSFSLKGCVNDAKSMKALLLHRFGFRESDIVMLLDEAATKDQIKTNFISLVNRVAKDDIVFVYYAGHGVTIRNTLSRTGQMTQGILASDFYSGTSSVIFDNELKRYYNAIIDKKGVLTVINDCCYSGGMAAGMACCFREMEEETSRSIYFTEAVEDTSDIDDTRALTDLNRDLRDATFVQPPAERPGSRFLFISAATDTQESKERNDLNNNRHGLFTTALVNVMKRNSASISGNALLRGVKEELDKQFVIGSQDPLMYGDINRFDKNLLGFPGAVPTNSTQLQVVEVKGKMVWLKNAIELGLHRGNKLRGLGSKQYITLVVEETANGKTAARVTAGNAAILKAGDEMKVVDWNSRSMPRLKIYLPVHSISLAEYNAIVKNVLQPALADPLFQDYESLGPHDVRYIYYHNGWKYWQAKEGDMVRGSTPPSTAINLSSFQQLKQAMKDKSYFIYLPLPSEVSKQLKQLLAGDQNIQFVTNPAEADMAIYSAYHNRENEMVFVVSVEVVGNRFEGSTHFREKLSHSEAAPLITANRVQPIAAALRQIILKRASFKGWLNDSRIFSSL